jgi:hypothetical protein
MAPKTGLIAVTKGIRDKLSVTAYTEARWNGVDGYTMHYEVMTHATGVNGNQIRNKYYRYDNAQDCMEAFLDMAAKAGHDITLVFRFHNGGTNWLQYGVAGCPGMVGYDC